MTTSDIKDPEKRMYALNKRRQHIEDEVAMLKDRHYCIECEIAKIQKAIGKY